MLDGSSGFRELAKDCVCFANGAGGEIRIGIEDGEKQPAEAQRVDASLVDRVRKRLGELTVNVRFSVECRASENGGEYLAVIVFRSTGVASTADGRYLVRIADTCVPVRGDEIGRLYAERPAVPWELLVSAVPASRCSKEQRADLCARLRDSDRVKSSVKEKSDEELLAHYNLCAESNLTQLGVLLIGMPTDRARLGSAPVLQAIKYDERGDKVAKYSWDDHELSPVDLVDAVWRGVPDFRETYEIPDGLFRTTIPAYDESVVRELLVNALVHRPYSQGGPIFLNLHPDRLTVANAGRLPFGVTPRNILHTSRWRNADLARVFHDIQLMEREGSGFDLMYDRLLATGRAAPTVEETVDAVHVTIQRRVLHSSVVRLVSEVGQRHMLTQRERITLGILGQSEAMTGVELVRALELQEQGALRDWLGRLVAMGVVGTSGRTNATRYFVEPVWLQATGIEIPTTLTRIQPHRLRALILEDLERYPESGRSEIQQRIGTEISPRTISRALKELVEQGEVESTGTKRWTRYRLATSNCTKPP